MATSRYKYRPPIKHLFVGLLMVLISPTFTVLIGKGEIVVSIIGVFFFLLLLGAGLSFLILYFRKFNVGDLIIGQDYLEIPGRWKDRTRLDLNAIDNISEFETYDHIIAIQCKEDTYLIERNWMRKQEFEIIRKKLLDI
jgi:hypothetical protein